MSSKRRVRRQETRRRSEHRYRSCARKVRYATRAEADERAELYNRIGLQNGETGRARSYECRRCGAFHVGRYVGSKIDTMFAKMRLKDRNSEIDSRRLMGELHADDMHQ